MRCRIEQYTEADIAAMLPIWNEVVEAGQAFPQEEALTLRSGRAFFSQQSHCGVARTEGGQILGLYILHPNNVGRCAHIANASYAVASAARGHGIGKALVRDSLAQARQLGFRIMQFNAVTVDNAAANNLYPQLGFTRIGCIPGGFRRPDGGFADINLYYQAL